MFPIVAVQPAKYFTVFFNTDFPYVLLHMWELLHTTLALKIMVILRIMGSVPKERNMSINYWGNVHY